jgi:hypothetical protein
MPQRTVHDQVEELAKSDIWQKSLVLSEYKEPDFTPPLYDVWKLKENIREKCIAAKVADMWLACATEDEIAKEVKCSIGTVSSFTGKPSEIASLQKLKIFSEYAEPDFQRPLYDVWKLRGVRFSFYRLKKLWRLRFKPPFYRNFRGHGKARRKIIPNSLGYPLPLPSASCLLLHPFNPSVSLEIFPRKSARLLI